MVPYKWGYTAIFRGNVHEGRTMILFVSVNMCFYSVVREIVNA